MITNFDRGRVQVFVEGKIGCPGSQNLKPYSDNFAEYEISSSDLAELKTLNLQDGRDMFFQRHVEFISSYIRHSPWLDIMGSR